MKLLMLGTGSAAVTNCYNTCFALIADDGRPMLVDAGGGNGILKQLERAALPLVDIHDMFITHTHTDHILGAVWIVRMVAQSIYGGKYSGTFTVRGHDEAIAALRTICFATLPVKVTCHIDKEIRLVPVADGEHFEAIGCDFTAFDICSTKAKQYGFAMQMPGGNDDERVVCLAMSHSMNDADAMPRAQSGCLARRSAFIHSASVSNPTKSIIARHSMQENLQRA